MVDKTTKIKFGFLLLTALVTSSILIPLHANKVNTDIEYRNYEEITKKITVKVIDSERVITEHGTEYRLRVSFLHPFKHNPMEMVTVSNCNSYSEFCHTASNGYYKNGKQIVITFVDSKPTPKIHLKHHDNVYHYDKIKADYYFEGCFITTILMWWFVFVFYTLVIDEHQQHKQFIVLVTIMITVLAIFKYSHYGMKYHKSAHEWDYIKTNMEIDTINQINSGVNLTQYHIRFKTDHHYIWLHNQQVPDTSIFCPNQKFKFHDSCVNYYSQHYKPGSQIPVHLSKTDSTDIVIGSHLFKHQSLYKTLVIANTYYTVTCIMSCSVAIAMVLKEKLKTD